LLLDFDAETKFPYGSRACRAPAALGHNLIHRICEEVDKRRAGFVFQVERQDGGA
jgi:hypothetical protein